MNEDSRITSVCPSEVTEIGQQCSSMALSSSDDFAVLGTRDGSLIRVNLLTKSIVRREQTDLGSIWSLVFIDDSYILAAGASGFIKKYSTNDLQEIFALKGHTDEVNALALSSTSKLFSVGDDRSVRRWDLNESEPSSIILYNHNSIVYAVDISNDNQCLATGSSDKELLIYSLSENKIIASLEGVKDRVWCVKFTGDSKFIVAGDEACEINVWSCSGWKLRSKITAHLARVRTIHISEDNQYLISGSLDKSVKVWRLNDGELNEIKLLEGHGNWVKVALLTNDQKRIVSSGDDSTLIVWDVAELKMSKANTGICPMKYVVPLVGLLLVLGLAYYRYKANS